MGRKRPGQQLTSAVHDSQHDGGDPRHLAAGHIENALDFFKEDGDGLGEGVGEADGDEGPAHHHPTPAALRWRVTLRTAHGRSHVHSEGFFFSKDLELG